MREFPLEVLVGILPLEECQTDAGNFIDIGIVGVWTLVNVSETVFTQFIGTEQFFHLPYEQ